MLVELRDPWLHESSRVLQRLEMLGGRTKLTAPPRSMPEPESRNAGGFGKTRHLKLKYVDIWLSNRRLMLRKPFCGAVCATRWASFVWTEREGKYRGVVAREKRDHAFISFVLDARAGPQAAVLVLLSAVVRGCADGLFWHR
jgi:hypothetical protein